MLIWQDVDGLDRACFCHVICNLLLRGVVYRATLAVKLVCQSHSHERDQSCEVKLMKNGALSHHRRFWASFTLLPDLWRHQQQNH
jgi:hypothetical protein